MLKRITNFLKEELWIADIRQKSKRKGFLIRTLRILVLAFKGFFDRITSYNVCYTKLLRMFNFGATALLPPASTEGDSVERLPNGTRLWVLAKGRGFAMVARTAPGDLPRAFLIV